MLRTTIVVAAGLALAALLPAAPAHALRARVFVSKAGADVGGCSFSAPCQSLDYALNGVEPSGEITILDSGGYNPMTITKGVTITVPPGVEAGIAAPAGGTAITINATQNDAVVLRGLTLAGANAATYGINANAAGKIEIIDCVIRDFSNTGLLVRVSNGSNTLLHVSNTKVMNNAIDGIAIEASSTSKLTAEFDHLTVIDNNSHGIFVGANTDAYISDSEISNNGIGGICNLEVSGDDPTRVAAATLRNVHLYPRSAGTCSIKQGNYTSIFMSQVYGGSYTQDFTSANVETDGTNSIDFPQNAVLLQLR